MPDATTLDPTVSSLRRVLDRVSARSAVVATNLANVDTPGYRALAVVFRDELGRAGGIAPLRTDPAHLGAAPPDRSRRVVEAPVTRIRGDGNTVDIDREMTLLAAMQGRYSAAAQMVRKRFALLEYAVSSGGQR